ncbi:hypothetical protein CON65_09385 [Bacillus pseudomycoides]|uniref:Immunity protein SdpI n=1 Tax=Bacillus pseudomycoides TaxID=64104 RepID=A0AA91VCY0_9BACI|nr:MULTISPECIES: DUF1648 domain-containing protein [Bacillus]PEB47997.1 hypothetical protein COO03_24715 [Bacillus sp. AFS098217]PED82875.1 hypothetical protein CON65_09385 [Bacillus pseudomycoides]PEU09712.1 hypothetical protein CN524_17910 [Bacillus sp. AFS019443]PEU18407.1 hypothetical protein CN525_11710 [Bacillus sp. AFS014408]PFW62651.1 hypothetical protein COL20_12060 [Bacillus sp. AFS075034]
MKNPFGIILLLIIIATNIALYFFLPSDIVTKWDFNGNPTSSMDKSTFIIINLILCSFLAFLFWCFSQAMENPKFFLWMGNTMLLFLFFTDIMIALIALGFPIPLETLVFFAVGLLLILTGYFSSKIDATKSTVSFQWNHKHLERKATKICSVSLIIAGIFICLLPLTIPAPYREYGILVIILGMTIVIIPSTIYLLIQDQKQSSKL